MITLDQLRAGVSLPSGTLGFPLPLVQLRGRNGMGADVTLLYSSTVQKVARTWNLEASTSVLGLGWTLQSEFVFADPRNQGSPLGTQYYLAGAGGVTPLVRTGTAQNGDPVYAARSYRFWTITHHLADESWNIVKEDGTMWVFGGGGTAGGAGYPASAGNSIQWGVRWGSWLGSSAVTQGQSNFPLVWNLSSVTGDWGDATSYTYTSFADDQVQVGTGGLYYTRASYPATITDPTGCTVTFAYAAKLYDTSTTQAQREYQAPHTGIWNTPVAYQDRYETRYLSSVAVAEADGSPVSTYAFAYQVVGDGDLAKRYLTSITRANPLGDTLAPLSFAYQYTDAQGNPSGVMTGATVPEGGNVAYGWGSVTPQLGTCDFNILQSGANPNLQKPRFWFDDDYVVGTWYDSGNRFAAPYVYQWEGRWVQQAFPEFAVAEQYDALQVSTERTFFAVLRPQYTASTPVKPALYLYHKNDAQAGAWITGSWVMNLADDEPVTLVTGDSWAAVLGGTSGSLLRFTWNGAAWVQETPISLPFAGQTPAYAITGRHNWLVSLARPYSSPDETAQVTLSYVDASGAWQTGFTGRVQTTAQNADAVALYAGDSFAVLRVENDRLGPNDYRYMALAWTPDLASVTSSMLIESGSEWTPEVRGPLVGIDRQIFRFNGSAWISLDLSSSAYRYPAQTGGYWLSYGWDTVVRRVEQSMSGSVDGYAYDITQFFAASSMYGVDAFNGASLPSLQETNWSFLPASAHTVRLPTRYALLSSKIYYNRPDGGWQVVGSIPDQVSKNNSASVQLMGENYLSYQQGSDAVVVPLRNGGTLAPIVMQGQTIYNDNTNGKLFTGVSAFVTFTGSADAPSSLTLHAMVNAQVNGAVSNPVVTSVTLDDGFDQTATAFAYEPASATTAGDGSASLFNQVTVYPGSATATPAVAGSQVTWFFNGLPASLLSVPFPTDDPSSSNAASTYHLLTGLSYLTRGYDASGTLVSTTTTWWNAFLVPLAQVAVGMYPRVLRSDQAVDGVTSTRLQVYDATTGLVNRSTSTNLNWAGTQEQVIDTYLYAWQAYPALQQLHLLSPVAQSTREVVTTARTQYTSVEVTTWQDWGGGHWAPAKTYRGVANVGAFDFAHWSGSTEPPASQWLRTSQVTARLSHGGIQVATDAMGVSTSTLYDTAQRVPLAHFRGADVTAGEAGYTGFEAYEDTSAWQLAGGAGPDGADAHTGALSMKVPGGGQGSASVSWAPPQSTATYLVSFWINTDPGFTADGGSASVQVAVTPASGQGSPGQSWSFPVADTGGRWTYLCSPALSLALTGGVAPKVTITAASQKAAVAYRVDDVRFAPVASAFDAAVYRTDLSLSATLGEGNELTRFVVDEFSRPVASVGTGEVVAAVSLPYQANDGGAALFSGTNPNAAYQLKAQQGGTYEDFLGNWQSRWVTTGGAWTASGGVLSYAGGQPGTTTWNGYTGQSSLGVRVQLGPAGGGAPTGVVGVALGNQALTWTPGEGGTGTWALNGTWVSTAPFGRDWTIAMVDSRVYAWVNGRQLVDRMPAVVTLGTVVLSASAAVSFQDVVVFVEPEVAAVFTDGGGKPRQSRTMDSGPTAVIAQTLYDALGRPAVEVKPSLVAVSASQGLLAYDAGYVTNGSPGAAGSVWATGMVTGSVNTYWPADQGYPFSRTAFEASPLGRVAASGLAGPDLAVGAHDTRITYGSDPQGNWFVQTVTDPDGRQSITTTDRAGNLVQRQAGPITPGASAYAVTSFQYAFNDQGTQVQVYPPNYAAPPAGSGAAKGYVITQQADFLGRLVSASGTDGGTTQYMYDPSGMLRYRLDADGAGAGASGTDRITWLGYDTLGRPTQIGHFDYNWAWLPSWVSQNGWTPATQLTVRKAFTYFGAGTQWVNRLQQVAGTPEGASSPSVTETLGYDDFNRLSTFALQSTTFDGSSPPPHTVTYGYAPGGATTSIATEAGTVTYAYNRRGLTQYVGTPASLALYGAYQYNADGSVRQEDLGMNVSRGVKQTFTYNSPGWLERITYATFSQAVAYQDGTGYGGARYYSGLIASAATSQTWSGAPSMYAYNFAYDGLDRMTVAENTISTAWGMGVMGGLGLDAGSNLLQLNRGNDSVAYTYATASGAATNRVAATTGAVARTYAYDPSGNITSDGAWVGTLSYDPVLRLPTSIALNTTATGGSIQSLAFEYGWTGERAVKTTTATGGATRQLYVRGAGSEALVELVKGSAGGTTTTMYVYGPTGRIAMVRAGTLYYLVRDQQGSTRVVYDAAGNALASFDYMPYGTLMRVTGDPSLIAYRYTGQEWDSFTGQPADDCGLYNYHARLYDPWTGRFYALDPVLDPTTSPYAYCGGDPVNMVDPDGRFFILALIILGAAGGGFAGYLIGRKRGAEGWSLAGYVAGGALIGGVTGAIGGFAATNAAAGLASLGLPSVAAQAAGGLAGEALAGALQGVGMSWLETGGVRGMGTAALTGAAAGAIAGAIGGGSLASGYRAVRGGGVLLAGFAAGATASAIDHGSASEIALSGLFGTAVAGATYAIAPKLQYAMARRMLAGGSGAEALNARGTRIPHETRHFENAGLIQRWNTRGGVTHDPIRNFFTEAMANPIRISFNWELNPFRTAGRPQFFWRRSEIVFWSEVDSIVPAGPRAQQVMITVSRGGARTVPSGQLRMSVIPAATPGTNDFHDFRLYRPLPFLWAEDLG